VVANDDVSLTVPEGAIVGLIGPNGSGKTTLFNSIVGYHAIDAGSIRFAGRELSRLRVPQIARLGLMRTFQQTRVYGRMTCLRNMLASIPAAKAGFLSMFWKFPPELVERAEELLRFVGLNEKRHLDAGDLSFGQQKLLELAMALMAEPRLLLLDEPTANLDGAAREQVIALIPTMVEAGSSIVIACHDRDLINLPGVQRLKLRDGRLEVREPHSS